MKKIGAHVVLALIAASIFLAATACTVEVSIKVDSVSLTKSTTTIAKGNTDTLYAVIKPWTATDQTVTWASSDTNIVTVAADTTDPLKCVVTAVAEGTANVTVTTRDGNKTATCAVTVSATGYKVTGKVVNVRQGVSATQTLPTGGTVEVTKFGSATVIKSATVGSDGTYTISDLPSGDYIIKLKNATLSSTDWVGVPVSIRVSGDISGQGVFAYDKASLAGKMVLILTWENKNYDVDSWSVIDSDDRTDNGYTTRVYYGAKNYNSGGNTVDLERDVLVSDITSGSYPVETTLVTSLATGTWLRFYAHAYTASSSISGLDDGTTVTQPAGVTVYAMYHDSTNAPAHYGTWYAPLNTGESAVGFVKIQGKAGGVLELGSFSYNGTATGNTTNTTAIKSFAPVQGVLVNAIE